MKGWALLRLLLTVMKFSDPSMVTLAWRDKRQFLIKTLLCARSQLLSCWKSGWLHWSQEMTPSESRVWVLASPISFLEAVEVVTAQGWVCFVAAPTDGTHEPGSCGKCGFPPCGCFLSCLKTALHLLSKHLCCSKEPCCSLFGYSHLWAQREEGWMLWGWSQKCLAFSPLTVGMLHSLLLLKKYCTSSSFSHFWLF